MSWMRKLLRTVRPEPLDDALDDELQFHLEQRTDAFVSQGMSPAEARRQAERLFGNRTSLRESTRDRDVLVWLENALQDLRYAVRGMLRRPGFTAAAALSLALGIGANTALFSLLDALVLKMAPVAQPSQLVRLQDGESDSLTHQAFENLQQHSGPFSAVTATRRLPLEVAIEERGEQRTVSLQAVSAAYFDTLGVDAAQGRVFHQSDGAVAVISQAYWRSHYAAAASALGAHLRYLNIDFTVVGIAPPGFSGMFLDSPAEIWVPLEQLPKPAAVFWTRARALVVLGRLQRGVTSAQAASQISGLLHRKITLLPGGNGYSTLRLRFLQPLTIVEFVAGLVLLIACANLANLMLARTASRQGELAIRQAIGASRSRLVRQSLTESLLVSFCGAALALLVAAWLSRALLRFLPPAASPALGTLSFHLSFPVLAFTAALAIFTCLLFGLAPALRVTRPAGQPSPRWSSRALVVCQVALCTILLTGAGLFLRTLGNLRQREHGFAPDHLLSASTVPIRGLNLAEMARKEEELRIRAAAIPGVRAAGFSDFGVLSGGGVEFHVEGDTHFAYRVLVSPDFFNAMGTPVLSGREFTAADESDGRPVALVNQAFARKFLPSVDPVGRRFHSDEDSPPSAFEVIGVVKDTRLANLREEPAPVYYLPYRERSRGSVSLAIRTAGDLRPVASALERMAREIDPRWGLKDAVPFSEIEDRTLVVERLVAQTSAAFGALAVLVAAIGLYGVLALGVARRTREIGLRIALGASRAGVRWLVVREAGLLLAVGVALGLPSALLAVRYVAALLYGLQAADAGNLGVTVLAMTVVAAASSLLPALRASRVDPMVALRCD